MADGRKDRARRFILQGRVQGMGVRPAIHRLAIELGLTGHVCNTHRGVETEVQGRAAQVARFAAGLLQALPAAAHVSTLRQESVAVAALDGFVIGRDAEPPADAPLAAQVPADLGVCAACRCEVASADDRRFGYGLTSCTACGPRFTVIRAMPYERADTTLAEFPFCAACLAEYEDPRSRRFHAQTNACPECGPQVWCVDDERRMLGRADAAVRAAAGALHRGRIAALRGVGGYQLLVDATQDQAVQRLRHRKERRSKPLAVMVESLAAARELAELDDAESAALCDSTNAIVLVRAREDSGLSPGIHPGLNELGLLLPTSPLHLLLLRAAGRPLVCTSGNREGLPLEFEVAASESALAGVADVWLHHNRPIARPIDDSVVRVIGGRATTIRLARGLAPLPLDLPHMPPTLALGGHLKAAVAWSNGAQAVLGPHVGDLECVAARERFSSHVHDLQRLYRSRPTRVVHDLHPGYYTTELTRELTAIGSHASAHAGLQRHRGAAPESDSFAVQHHEAHIAAVMLEHGWLDRDVLGVAWDGTGFGSDGHIWGGEFFAGNARLFRRIAALREFPLPGGEAAIRQPWRTALVMVRDAAGAAGVTAMRSTLYEFATPRDVELVEQLIARTPSSRPRLSPVTTSAGRLFDAAATLVLGIGQAEFEGQPAMLLEAAADRTEPGRYPLPLAPGPIHRLDWRPLIRGLLADRAAGISPGSMAMRFHRGVADGILAVGRLRRELPIVLSGGVFQNRLLLEALLAELTGEGRACGTAGRIPPNDGGLAAGQLAIAAMRPA